MKKLKPKKNLIIEQGLFPGWFTVLVADEKTKDYVVNTAKPYCAQLFTMEYPVLTLIINPCFDEKEVIDLIEKNNPVMGVPKPNVFHLVNQGETE